MKRTEVVQGSRILAHNDWTALPSPFPMLLAVSQQATTTFLQDRALELGASVARGWRVAGFEPCADGVRVDLSNEERSSTIRSRFLVGCDGAHSTVRALSGVRFDGDTYPETFLLADIAGIDPEPPFVSRLFVHQEGPMLYGRLAGGLARIGGVIADGFEPSEAAIAKLIASRSHNTIHFKEVVRANVYRAHRRLVDRMRTGPVFLAGDAAHIHSPVGGQGMNLGIRDAFDLGHRLGAVQGGDAPSELLDGYDTTRRAEAVQVLANTSRLSSIVMARGMKRLVVNTALTVANKVGPLHSRLSRQISGIDTPWPPGVERPGAQSGQ